MKSLILASASPRRKDLLQEHGYRVRIQPAEIQELTPEHLTVGEITLFNAKLKAGFVAAQEPGELVLAADTLVSFEGHILGKPNDLEEAFSMLSLLAGKTHEVFSGVWLCRQRPGASGTPGVQARGFIEASRVTFRPMSPDEIREYMARIGPLDKAGAYAAQENELGLIQSVQGSWTNVIGLPMETLNAILKAWEAPSEPAWHA